MESIEHKETKKCPSCDESISVKAKRCPKCQVDLRSWFRRHPILTFLLILISSPLWLAFIGGIFSGASSGQKNTNSSPEPSRKLEFKAAVNFTGTQFVITNLEQADCQNVKMEINGGLLKDGFSMDGYRLEANQVYTVGAGEFVNKDGDRFNPFSKKPQSINIFCRGDNELSYATFYGEF